MNNYPQVVKDIHDEFNLAGEKLLQESLAIIENAEKIDIDKAQRLNDVGFVNNPLLNKAKQIEESTREAAEMAKLVMDYKHKYPLNKFIITSDVDKICAKYKLVRGNTEQYIGFVPAKNLSEIESFKKNHQTEQRYYITGVEFSYTSRQKQNERLEAKLKSQGNQVNDSFMRTNLDGDIKRYLEHYFLKDTMGNREYVAINKVTSVKISPFDIVAPKKDMISNEKYSKLKGLFAPVFSVAPDPVVLYPVERGYIIVTAWGDEASDPLVANEQMN